jgi:hypothetical protein
VAAAQGHKIKNPRMQLRKHLDSIPARIRVIISGTPIQNNLQEMHTLFDFACPVRACVALVPFPKICFQRQCAVGGMPCATSPAAGRGTRVAEAFRLACFVRVAQQACMSSVLGSRN